MTTTDARKRRHERDMRDAHETARARDERASTVTYEVHMCTEGNADFDHVINCPALHTLRTRTHAINPTTGEFTRLDQENDTMTDHRAEAERLLAFADSPNIENVAEVIAAAHVYAALAIHDTLKVLAGNTAEQHATLTEIRDRLPEREGVKDEPASDEPCGDLNPIRGDRPCRLPRGHGSHHDDGAGRRWWPSTDPSITSCHVCGSERPLNAICPACEPAPADEDPDEALAKVLERVGERPGGDYAALARAAREHIEAEREDDTTRGKILRLRREATEKVVATSRENAARIEKAEAALARVAEERDKWKRLAHEQDDNAKRHCARAERAEADLADMTRQRDDLSNRLADARSWEPEVERLRTRYNALRAGVERVRRNRTTFTDVLMCIADVLDLDDAHEPQHDPDAVTPQRTEPAP